jgi:hypothetical protein|tara:strand:+ start:379 stop:615 length:237 start_codon:yes stop_codon:yes gene_type:complete
MTKQTNPWIKWLLTSLMLSGAITTSLELNTLLGLSLLVLGNIGWASVLLRIREWAAATVFITMGCSWSLGLINYFFFK